MPITADDIIRVSENVVKIYVKRYPQPVDFTIYRGDSWSFTIIGLNEDDTPFDWSLCDSFAMNFRSGHALNPDVAVSLDEEHFILGKTNLEQAAYDELHLTDTQGRLFTPSLQKKLLHDVQYVVAGQPYTAIKGCATLQFDTTREEQYA